MAAERPPGVSVERSYRTSGNPAKVKPAHEGAVATSIPAAGEKRRVRLDHGANHPGHLRMSTKFGDQEGL